MTTKLKIPKLRFSEFSGEWEEKKLKDFAKINPKNGKLPDEFIYIDLESVNNGVLTKENTISANIAPSRAQRILEKNDILYQTVRPYQKNNLFFQKKGKYIASTGYAQIRKEENSNYLFQFLHTDNFVNKVLLRCTGTSYPAINSSDLGGIKINFPENKEQEKIANFLSSVDKKIELLEEEKKNTEEYKKGVMQKIFSQELRFKDENGEDFGEWEEKKLGDIGEFRTSSVDKKIVEGEKEVYLLNYMDVYKHKDINNKNKENLMVVTAKESQLSSSNLLKGDILFTPSSETPDDIGHSIVIFEDLENTLFSYHLMRFRPSIKLNILYSHYFCNIPDVLKQITEFATGSTRFTISVGEFSKIKINLPSFEEQEKIADFLSKIDEKIELIDTKLEKTKNYKKGLLQDMFV